MKEGIKKALNYARTLTTALVETILSAVLVVVFYLLYLPFGILRAIFSRKQIREFFEDVMWLADTIFKRKKKQ